MINTLIIGFYYFFQISFEILEYKIHSSYKNESSVEKSLDVTWYDFIFSMMKRPVWNQKSEKKHEKKMTDEEEWKTYKEKWNPRRQMKR